MILDAILQNWLSLLAPFIVCATLCTVFELLFNLDRSLFSRVRGAFFWSICLFGIALGVVATQQLLRAVGIPPFISLDLSRGNDELDWLIRPLVLVPLAFFSGARRILLVDLSFRNCTGRCRDPATASCRRHSSVHQPRSISG